MLNIDMLFVSECVCAFVHAERCEKKISFSCQI